MAFALSLPEAALGAAAGERGKGGDEHGRGTEFHDRRLYSEWRAIAAGPDGDEDYSGETPLPENGLSTRVVLACFGRACGFSFQSASPVGRSQSSRRVRASIPV